MKRWLPLGLFGMACTLGLLFPMMSRAQNPAPAPAAPEAPPAVAITAEAALVQLREADEALAKKLETVRALIDVEAAAKRIAAPVAQSLQWSLRNAALANATDFNVVIGSSRVPVDNAAIVEALRVFEAEWSATQALRAKLLKGAALDARQRVQESTRTAKTPEELDPLLALVDRLQDAAQGRPMSSNNTLNSTSFSSLQPYLRALRRLIEVSSPPRDPQQISAAIANLRGNNPRGWIDENEIQTRIERVTSHFQKAMEEAQEALDQLVREKKSAAEYATALGRLEQAAQQSQAVSTMSGRGFQDSNGLLAVYRNVGLVIMAREAGDFAAAKSAMGNLRGGSLQALGSVKALAYTQQISAWMQEMEAAGEQTLKRQREEWRARLAAVKRPADLDALVSDLTREGMQARDRGNNDSSQALAAELNMLSAAWTGANPGFLGPQNSLQNATRLGPEVAELRRRIERDISVRALRAPELDQPPLAAMPLEAALDQFMAQLAEKGEWRRVLQLIEARAGAGRAGGSFVRESDLATAVRAFLAGQNLELAEQWSDAMLSYKAVLRCTDDKAPTKEAAARVIALTKAHPALFAPQPPAPAVPSPGALPPGNPRPRAIIPAPQTL